MYLIAAAVDILEEKLDLAVGVIGSGIDYLESPVSDGTIEENFEEALVDAPVIETGINALIHIYTFVQRHGYNEEIFFFFY